LAGRLALGVRNSFDSSLEASKSSAAKLEAPIHFFTTCAARCAAGDFVLFCESPTLFLGNLGLVAVQQALQLLAQAILSPFVCSTSRLSSFGMVLPPGEGRSRMFWISRMFAFLACFGYFFIVIAFNIF
jgi:hypothetical protein